MRAIKDTGNQLCIAYDPNDSVGVIDSFFPDSEFFTSFEIFQEQLYGLQKVHGKKIDYMAVCSPNHLHFPHIAASLRAGCDVICEKPLVPGPEEADALLEIERDTGKRVYNILQLRLHKSVLKLLEEVNAAPATRRFNVELKYVTSRGKWYLQSWKGDSKKSFGVATNIGVHFFDMLYFIFGELQDLEIHYRDEKTVSGYLQFNRARVKWFLSVDEAYLPNSVTEAGTRTYRSLTIEGEELEFSGGFTDLHTLSYEQILSGNGFGSIENRAAIRVVEQIRHMEIVQNRKNFHPILETLS